MESEDRRKPVGTVPGGYVGGDIAGETNLSFNYSTRQSSAAAVPTGAPRDEFYRE